MTKSALKKASLVLAPVALVAGLASLPLIGAPQGPKICWKLTYIPT
jgi:hypothetical protein